MLKIIEGKHYVDGGPECWKCNGDGYKRVLSDNGYSNVGESFLGRPVNRDKRGKCNACNGTKVNPVESWDADQCWTWFATYYKRGIEQREKTWIFYYHANQYSGRKEIDLGEQPNITAALRAAVIAVAERESQTPKG